MSTVASLGSAVAGAVLSMLGGEVFSYTVTGTFVGTWVLEFSNSLGAAWATYAAGTDTGDASGTVAVLGPKGSPVMWRFRCTDYTSGTIVGTITAATNTVETHVNRDGTVTFKRTDAGIEVLDIQATTGTVATLIATSLTTVSEKTTAGASTAAAGSTTTDAAVLPNNTGSLYPTTAANDAKGVRIHAGCNVTGRRFRIHNGVADKILKVYPPTGGTINALSADAAFSPASGAGCWAFCNDGATGAWFCW